MQEISNQDIYNLLLENNKILKHNNSLLQEIHNRLEEMNCGDTKIADRAIAFGIGICSNIVGDRLLGLGRNNT